MSIPRHDQIILPPVQGSAATTVRAARISGTTSTTPVCLQIFNMSYPIVSSTDATPIVLTVAAGHGLVNGDSIDVSGHLVNTNANGTWVVSAAGATTVTLTGSTSTGGGAGVATGVINLTDQTILRPKNKVWVHFEGSGDNYIRVGSSATAGTTSSNGMRIDGGDVSHPPMTQRFYLQPSTDIYVDALSVGATATLKWYICSHPCERERI